VKKFKKDNSVKTKLVLLLSVVLFLTQACMEAPGGKRSKSSSSLSNAGDLNGGGSNGNPAVPDDGGTNNSLLDVFELGEAELRHIIDPKSGTFKTKVTIPKNFTGLLYLSGLNISSLSNRHIYARFNFGRDYEPITIEATIGRAEGIIPQIDIDVIILDLQGQPFRNMRLLYDFYDYNDYDLDDDGIEELTPTTDPRDKGLFCRGLRLSNDPTFFDSNTDGLCNATGDRCSYSYAKVIDSGLHVTASNLPIPVQEPQIAITSPTYSDDSDSILLTKCLPDNNDLANFNASLGLAEVTPPAIGNLVTMNGISHKYDGPFRTTSQGLWEITSGAMFSTIAAGVEPSGLFQTSYTALDPETGYKSFLFPRTGKVDLRAGVQYLGSDINFDPRIVTSLVSSGATKFVNGCSIRMMNKDFATNEGIESCNVTATIELITFDPVTLGETVLVTSEEVKLQLSGADVDNVGQDVLYSALNTCTNSNSCGSGECCYNSRCWSKDLVTQCLEDSNATGNVIVGGSCQTDYECSSLCCNSGTKTCSTHINTSDQEVLCSKQNGESCIAKEWCAQQTIPQCFIVKTGTTPLGQLTCALRCYNVQKFGNCTNGRCIPPTIPDVPVFDSANPNCAGAIDPPDPSTL
jgi:hypothetical protein